MKKVRIILLSIAFAIQIYKICQLYYRRNKYRKLIALLGQLKLLSPSEIISKIQKSKLSQSFQLCIGKVFPSEPIFSFLKPNLNILSSNLYEGDYTKNGGARQKLLNKRQPSHYIIKDSQNQLKIYEVHHMIHDYTAIIRKVKRTLAVKISNFIKSIFKKSKKQANFMDQFFQSDNVYEVFMPSGKEYSILAKFSKQDGEICCYKPIIITHNRENMNIYLQNITFKKTLLISGFTIGAILCLTIIIYQLWKNYKEYRLRKLKQSVVSLSTIIVKSRICSICKKNLSCIFNKPCNHMPVCQDCFPQKQSCSQCCKPIDENIQYFVC